METAAVGNVCAVGLRCASLRFTHDSCDLQRENKALRYRMMLLNRTMRSCGCNHTDLPFDAFIEEEAAPFPCDKERSTAEIRASVDEMLDRGVVDTDTTQQVSLMSHRHFL